MTKQMHQEAFTLNDEYWTDETVDYLYFLARHNNEIDSDKILTHFIKEFHISSIMAKQHIFTIYNHPDTKGIFEKQTKHINKIKRPSVFSPLKSININFTKIFYENIWNKYLTPSSSQQDLIFFFVCSLAKNGHLPYPSLIERISLLRLCDVTTELSLLYPISTKFSSDLCSELPISYETMLILLKLLRGRHNENQLNYLLLPETKTKRKHALDKILAEQLKYYQNKETNTLFRYHSINNYLISLETVAVINGLPPVLQTILKAENLPATGTWTDYCNFFHKKPVPSNKTRKISNKPHLFDLKQNTRPEKHKERSKINIDVWKLTATTILLDFRNSLDKINISSTSERVTKQIFDQYYHYINLADEISPTISVLHIALEWLTDNILFGKVNAHSTVAQYISEYFVAGLLNFEQAPYFSSASSKEHQDFIIHNVTDRNIESSLDKHFSMLKRIYNYAHKAGYLSDINFSVIQNSFKISRKSIILWPSDYDFFIQEWHNNNDWRLHLLAIAADLAYYAGLRASEITDLNLEDIIFSAKSCEIIIREGKSRAASRIIPFHILSPVKSVQKLKNIWDVRVKLTNNNRKLALFGPDTEKTSYSKPSFIEALTDGLKINLDISMSPHKLRHCFTNNLTIRLSSLTDNSLLGLIPDAEHEIFNHQQIASLDDWVFSKSEKEKLGENCNIYWHGARLLGHASPNTSFLTYCHIHPYLYKSYFQSLDIDAENKLKLTRQAAQLLLPNMKSSKTCAHKFKPNMTLSDAVELAKKDT